MNYIVNFIYSLFIKFFHINGSILLWYICMHGVGKIMQISACICAFRILLMVQALLN